MAINRPNLKALMATGSPVLFMGPPGVGKTAWINHEMKTMGIHMETVIASVREPSDIAGLPILTADGVTYSIPAWANRVNTDTGKPRVVFFDEITTAAPSVQAALLRVIHEGVVGETKLGRGVYFMAAANPSEYAANGYELSAPLANRFIHLTLKEDVKDFVDNFPSYWGDPPELPGMDMMKWEMNRGEIAAYLSVQQTKLLVFPENDANRSKAWPSPRTWDMASRIRAACATLEEAIPLVVGAIGEGEGISYFNWLRTMDLPKPQDVIDKWQSFKVPDRSDKTFAIMSNLVPYTISNLEKKNWDATWGVIGKICESSQPDVAAIWAIKLAKFMKPEWGMPPVFLKFAALFGDIKK